MTKNLPKRRQKFKYKKWRSRRKQRVSGLSGRTGPSCMAAYWGSFFPQPKTRRSSSLPKPRPKLVILFGVLGWLMAEHVCSRNKILHNLTCKSMFKSCCKLPTSCPIFTKVPVENDPRAGCRFLKSFLAFRSLAFKKVIRRRVLG